MESGGCGGGGAIMSLQNGNFSRLFLLNKSLAVTKRQTICSTIEE